MAPKAAPHAGGAGGEARAKNLLEATVAEEDEVNARNLGHRVDELRDPAAGREATLVEHDRRLGRERQGVVKTPRTGARGGPQRRRVQNDQRARAPEPVAQEVR